MGFTELGIYPLRKAETILKIGMGFLFSIIELTAN